MESNLSRYRNDLDALIRLGHEMKRDLLERLSKEEKERDRYGVFESKYQRWYTEASALLKHTLPERLPEFQQLYQRDPKRRTVTADNYSIQDWLMGIRAAPNQWGQRPFDAFAVTAMRFHIQLDILESAGSRFESSLFEIRRLLQADLFDNEIDAARELLRNGFARAAGAMAGVVLESHLAEVCAARRIPVNKKRATINDLNNILKDNSVIDVPTWRFIQHLGDLRNLCDHKREREPTSAEVAELIDGTAKITKTVF